VISGIFFGETITNIEYTTQLWRLFAYNVQVIFVTNVVPIEISSEHGNYNVAYHRCSKNTASARVHCPLDVDHADAHEVFS